MSEKFPSFQDYIPAKNKQKRDKRRASLWKNANIFHSRVEKGGEGKKRKGGRIKGEGSFYRGRSRRYSERRRGKRKN